MITRRFFLAAPVLTVGPVDSLHREAAVVLASGAVFTCPWRRARVLAVLHLREMEVALVAFACDGAGMTLDLAAFVRPDGVLLALERLEWRGAGGASLSTRVAMLPDRRHVTLTRSAALREAGGWRRESWTDYLRLDVLRMVDAPPRAVLPGSWQEGLCRERQVVAAGLERGVTGEMLGIFRRKDFFF